MKDIKINFVEYYLSFPLVIFKAELYFFIGETTLIEKLAGSQVYLLCVTWAYESAL